MTEKQSVALWLMKNKEYYYENCQVRNARWNLWATVIPLLLSTSGIVAFLGGVPVVGTPAVLIGQAFAVINHLLPYAKRLHYKDSAIFLPVIRRTAIELEHCSGDERDILSYELEVEKSESLFLSETPRCQQSANKAELEAKDYWVACGYAEPLPES